MTGTQKFTNEENVFKIKEFIYNKEQELIRQKRFLDGTTPIFLTDIEILGTKISQNNIWQILDDLKTNASHEFIIFENPGYQNGKTLPRYYVRSRIYHTVWCLYKSVNVVTSPYKEERDVGDIQFMRHIKRRPKFSNSFDDIFNDTDIQEILNWPKEKTFENAFKAMRKAPEQKIKKISNFQLKSTNTILKNLAGNKTSKGITIVAGTGWGKSLAYQFPLLLWILKKKIEKYNEILQDPLNKKKKNLQVNCSAILIFPRNALAQDQFESLTKPDKGLISIINNYIDSEKTFDSKKKKFLKIKNPVQDYASKISSKLDEKYGTDPNKGNPDIIITSTETLTRRLLNPACHPVYRNGVDLVLVDEVHLWEGLHGSYICSLIARLRNLLEHHKKPPLFVGMSATIEKPEEHCQKLFSLPPSDKPITITQEDTDDTERYATEYHLMLKPRSGRSSNGVAINTLSCLIHNRRDGMGQYHRDRTDTENKPKSITFIDSLHGTSKFTNDLNDYEYFHFPRTIPQQNPLRRYLIFNKPEERDHKIASVGGSIKISAKVDQCSNCIDRTIPMMLNCESYLRGRCWYYSQDDAGYFDNIKYGNWRAADQGRAHYPPDNIRSDRVSSQDEAYDDKYDYFRMAKDMAIFDRLEPRQVFMRTEIDNIVATSAMEVGVDFNGIKEIIQYGDVRSPSSYRQKTGRGAREGNNEDGLFVMSIINNSALGHSRFKHFKRLVNDSLDPVKLKTSNPSIIKSQCFSSIFDYVATKTNIFKIKKLTETTIKQNFNEVKQILQSRELEYYLEQFMKLHFNFNQKIIPETIEAAKKFFDELSKEIELDDNNNKTKKKMSLYEWLSQLDNTNILNSMMIKYNISDAEKQEQTGSNITTEIDNIRTISKKSSNHEKIKELLNNIPGVLND